MTEKDYRAMYTNADREVMKAADGARDNKKDKVEELVEFAKQSNVQRIGIASCVSFKKQAEATVKYLTDQGFEVYNVDCKMGKIQHADLVDGATGIACNPVGQAHFLAEKDTQLNISFGLCTGHDILFNSHTKAPVSTVMVKDRRLKHKTIDRFTAE